MQRYELDDIIKFCCTAVNRKHRFSELSEIELLDLWKGTSKNVLDQMMQKKSVNIHGLGSFCTIEVKNKTQPEKWISAFFPSHNWNKLPGYQVERIVSHGEKAAEPLNLASIATITGFTRDLVQAGLKDIINGIIKSLMRGMDVFLAIPLVGNVVFQNGEVKFKFAQSFTQQLNLQPKQPSQGRQINLKSSEDGVSTVPDNFSKNLEVDSAAEAQPSPIIQGDCFPVTPPERVTKSKPIATKQTVDPETASLVLDLELASEKLAKLEELIDKTFSADVRIESVHQHHHSGNRLWKDKSCPICNVQKEKIEPQTSSQKAADKFQDKMLLHVSLEAEKDMFDKEKAIEEVRNKHAVEIAAFNHKIWVQKKEARNTPEKYPIGDLFAKRHVLPPKMSPKEMAQGIQSQIKYKEQGKRLELEKKQIQNKLISERLIKEIKGATYQAHIEHLAQRDHLKNALSQQMKLKKELAPNDNEIEIENPFARNESLMALYQREKAKQTYFEQLAIVKQREEYIKNLTEMDRKNALQRIEYAKNELEKDLAIIKKEKERMLTHQILKRLVPNEGKLLNDPTVKVKIRFRLGGQSFPPKIMFKVFTAGICTQYFTGHTFIEPGSMVIEFSPQACEDAYNVMGGRLYTQQILLPDLNTKKSAPARPSEVTDKIELVQYLSELDGKAPQLGGRNNTWREISLKRIANLIIEFCGGILYCDRAHVGRTKKRGIDYTYDLVNKLYKKKETSIAKSGKSPINNDDGFGVLLEWAQHLDENNLNDYEID